MLPVANQLLLKIQFTWQTCLTTVQCHMRAAAWHIYTEVFRSMALLVIFWSASLSCNLKAVLVVFLTRASVCTENSLLIGTITVGLMDEQNDSPHRSRNCIYVNTQWEQIMSVVIYANCGRKWFQLPVCVCYLWLNLATHQSFLHYLLLQCVCGVCVCV